MRTLSSAELRREIESIELALEHRDYELANWIEKRLWKFVILAAEDCAPNAAELASEATKAKEIIQRNQLQRRTS